MKLSIFLRLSLGLGIAVFIFASALRASLEDILAPLSIAEVASVSSPGLRHVAPVESLQQAQAPVAVARTAVDQRPAKPILASDVQAGIVQALTDSLRPSGALSLVALRDFPDLSSYSQPFEVTLVNQPGSLSRGNLLIGFQVENEKGVLGEWTIPFRVQLFSEVWYPRSHLRRGELASASDFDIRSVDMLADPDAVPATLESLLRHEYSRDVTPGKPLHWSDLSERSLVRKGDVVEVSAVNGLLAITMRAVARQDGGDGDLIILRNIDSAKEFSARVIGENRVEIIF